MIRNLHGSNALIKAFYTETRPYNQGSRLTGYEMIQDQIPAMMITDSMAAALLCDQGEPMNITAVIVGADRVAANGDTANKIGTYQLAIVARHHGIKFLVAAPRTTIDMNTLSGRDIKIEQRPSDEVTHIKVSIIEESINKDISLNKDDVASINIAAKGTQAWNPAFDITPAKLIDAIVTEVGVVEKNNEGLFDLATIFTKNEEKQPIE